MGSENRQRHHQIKVRVNAQELDIITALAQQCDLAPSTLLRELGLGHQPKSTVDSQAIEQLARLHGDLGRVGGLLKMWLTTPGRKGFAHPLNIPDLINQLRTLQKDIRAAVEKL